MMAEQYDIAILNAEARRRGISYGKLVATLSWEERRALLERGQKELERKQRKRKKDTT